MKISHIWATTRSFIAKVTPWAFFACLAVAMLFDPSRDTLGVAGAAFAVTLALASVTFSYARTLKDGSAIRDELIFAGERLVGGAVLFLGASILNHASNDIPRYANALFQAVPRPEGQTPDMTLFGQNVFGLMIAIVAFFFFLVGLLCAQMGMSILIRIANHRAKRRPGHGDYFASAKSMDERVSKLDEVDRGEGTQNQGARDSAKT